MAAVDDMVREDDPEPIENRFSDFSITDLIKQEAKELANNKQAFIPVKGYQGTGLQVCYRLPERGKELDDIARRIFRETKESYYRNLYIAIDTMTWLCEGLFVQPEGVETPVMLDPQDVGVPVNFDARLAEILGMPDPNAPARNIVRALFGGNDLAINAHAEKLQRWLQDTKADLTLELWQLGEV